MDQKGSGSDMDPVLLDFGRRNVFCNKMGIGGKHRHWQRFGRIPNAFPNRSNGNMGLACVGSGFQMQDKRKRVCFSWQTFLIYLFDAYLYFYVVCESFGMGYCMEVFDQRAGYRGNFCFMQRFDSYTGDIYFREINFEKIIFAKSVLWYNLSHTAVGRV